MCKNLIILVSCLGLIGCADGKTCNQSYIDIVDVENKTGTSIDISVSVSTIMEGVKTLRLQLLNGQSESKYQINSGSFEREGQQRKIGPRYDAQCSLETEKYGASVNLNSTSFLEFRHCYDYENRKSFIVNLTDSCPSGSFVQNNPVD